MRDINCVIILLFRLGLKETIDAWFEILDFITWVNILNILILAGLVSIIVIKVNVLFCRVNHQVVVKIELIEADHSDSVVAWLDGGDLDAQRWHQLLCLL